MAVDRIEKITIQVLHDVARKPYIIIESGPDLPLRMVIYAESVVIEDLRPT